MPEGASEDAVASWGSGAVTTSKDWAFEGGEVLADEEGLSVGELATWPLMSIEMAIFLGDSP
jgi:hypothetical protein